MDNSAVKETRFSGKYKKEVLQILWLAYRPYRWPLIFSIIIGFLGRLFLLANANIIGIWVNSFASPSQGIFEGFHSVDFIWLLTGISLIGFFLTWFYRLAFSNYSARAVSQIYDETTYRVSRYPLSFFDRTPAGVIITRFSSDYGSIFRLFGGPLAEFISIIFDLLGMIILITVASPYYLPLLLITAAFDYFVYRINRDRLRSARRDLSASRSPSVAHYAETAQGASSIRTFSKQEVFKDRFAKLDQYYLKQKLRTVRQLTWFSSQMSTLTAGLLFALGGLSLYLYQHGLVQAGSIGVAFGFVALSGNSIHMFFEWLAQFEEAMTGVERLDNYLRRDLEPGAKLPAQSQFSTEHPRQEITAKSSHKPEAAHLVVDNLWFRYGEDLPYVLRGLSFELSPKERLGIVGRTGSGKSSLTQCLFYFYPIDKGIIKINEQSPSLPNKSGGVDLDQYRQMISFIAQDPILFQGTIQENLDISSLHSESRLIEVLHQVGLEQFAHPSGLKFKLEEKARNLSVGEKQLLCMARCLLQDAPLVIMDEATSSVDPRSEEILGKATAEFFKNKTQIIIAHRLSTLQHCDRILWLHDGEIQMLGTPNEVLPVFQKSNLSLSFNKTVVRVGDERGH